MLLIGNEWRDTGKHLAVRNPATDQELGRVAVAGLEEVRQALEAAQGALVEPLSSYQRSSLLRALHERLVAGREEMARLICQETGKAIGECRQEVDRALTTLQLSAEEALRVGGEVLPCDVTDQEVAKRAMAVRVPLGVVAAITPFNFPLNVPMHKVGPALAGGNAVILKPSPQAPLTANRLGELAVEAGWPPGWLNILQGDHRVVEMLVASDVQVINLTGGPAAGQAVSRYAFG
ncbi:MAG: aldehyde dehydrogenase family protein, partial [Nitrospinota bacterium]